MAIADDEREYSQRKKEAFFTILILTSFLRMRKKKSYTSLMAKTKISSSENFHNEKETNFFLIYFFFVLFFFVSSFTVVFNWQKKSFLLAFILSFSRFITKQSHSSLPNTRRKSTKNNECDIFILNTWPGIHLTKKENFNNRKFFTIDLMLIMMKKYHKNTLKVFNWSHEKVQNKAQFLYKNFWFSFFSTYSKIFPHSRNWKVFKIITVDWTCWRTAGLSNLWREKNFLCPFLRFFQRLKRIKIVNKITKISHEI